MHSAEVRNGNRRSAEPIPDDKPNDKPIINIEKFSKDTELNPDLQDLQQRKAERRSRKGIGLGGYRPQPFYQTPPEIIPQTPDPSFATFLEEFNKAFGTEFHATQKTIASYNARLETFTPEKILKALSNISLDKFYQGENERRWRADPEWMLKSDEVVDKLINKKGKSKFSIIPW